MLKDEKKFDPPAECPSCLYDKELFNMTTELCVDCHNMQVEFVNPVTDHGKKVLA